MNEHLLSVLSSIPQNIGTVINSQINWLLGHLYRFRQLDPSQIQANIAAKRSLITNDTIKQKLEYLAQIQIKHAYLQTAWLALLDNDDELEFDWEQDPDHIVFEQWLSQSEWNNDSKLLKYIESVDQKLSQNNQFQAWKVQQERELTIWEQKLNLEINKHLQEKERLNYLDILHQSSDLSPMRIIAQQLLNDSDMDSLRILLAPLATNLPSRFPQIATDLESQLSKLANLYLAHGRPVKFIPGAWSDTNYGTQTAANALFYYTKSLPILILEPQVPDQNFYLNHAFWGINWSTYRFSSLVDRLPWSEIQNDLGKIGVIKWQQERQSEMKRGGDPSLIDDFYGKAWIELFTHNLSIMSKEHQAKQRGMDITRMNRPYKLTKQDLQKSGEYLVTLHCIWTGILIDEYYLLHAPTEKPLPPILPEILPELLSEITDMAKPMTINNLLVYYSQWKQVLEAQGQSTLIPELHLDLAQSLLKISEPQAAQQQLNQSLHNWLGLRGLSVSSSEQQLDLVESNLTVADLDYVNQLNSCLQGLGLNRTIDLINTSFKQGLSYYQSENYQQAILELDQAIAIIPDPSEAYYYRALSYLQLDKPTEALADFNETINLRPSWNEVYYYRGKAYSQLRNYEQGLADFDKAIELGMTQAVADREITIAILNEIKNQPRSEDSTVLTSVRPENLTDVSSANVEAERQRLANYAAEVERRRLAANANKEPTGQTTLIQGEADHDRRRLAQQAVEEERRKLSQSSRLQNDNEFEFTIVLLDAFGQEVSRSIGRAQHFKEDIGNGVILEMVSIPGGTFEMGSNNDPAELPIHEVTVKPFFLGKYTITQAQWLTIMGNNPSKFKAGDNYPVESVSWNQAVEFCQKLAKKTGKPYRLPSEAEWAYACRGGMSTPFHFGQTITTDVANYDGKSAYGQGPKGIYRKKTTPVGSFGIANAFGLYDMHGNVWEWCADPWHPSYDGAPSTGIVWEEGGDPNNRTLRGGSWLNSPRYCRNSDRNSWVSYIKNNNVGFRVALTL